MTRPGSGLEQPAGSLKPQLWQPLPEKWYNWPGSVISQSPLALMWLDYAGDHA